MDTLQLVLVIGLVVMALINTASLIWAFYLDHKLRGKPTPKIYDVHVEGTKVFPEMDMNEVEKRARMQLQQTVEEAATRLQASLHESVDQVAARLDNLAETSLAQEFTKYQTSLQALRDQSIAAFDKVQTELDEHRTELLKNLESHIASEQEKRLKAFDMRINDVISSYLAESLGNNVDLGAQTSYILQVLEQHKDEIKKDVLS